jgi:hypothetical protein
MPSVCCLSLGRKVNTRYFIWWWQKFGDQHFNRWRFLKQEIMLFYCLQLSKALVTKSSFSFMLSQFYPFLMSEIINTNLILSSYRQLSCAQLFFFRKLLSMQDSINMSCPPYLLHITLIALPIFNRLKTQQEVKELYCEVFKHSIFFISLNLIFLKLTFFLSTLPSREPK